MMLIGLALLRRNLSARYTELWPSHAYRHRFIAFHSLELDLGIQQMEGAGTAPGHDGISGAI